MSIYSDRSSKRKDKLHMEFAKRIRELMTEEEIEKYYVEDALFEFFCKVDEASKSLKENNKNAIKGFKSKESIHIKERMSELHFICMSIFNTEGIHGDTVEHLSSVRGYTKMICMSLMQDSEYSGVITERDVELVKMAAAIHDIAKLIIKADFLYDGRRYTNEEYNFMKKHVRAGEIMAEYVKIANKHLARLLDVIIRYISEHHENLDGTGYPRGKSGDQISIYGRILRAADSMEAMVSFLRAYRVHVDFENAINDMLSKPKIYDPVIVYALYNSLRHSMVEMKRIYSIDQERIEEYQFA